MMVVVVVFVVVVVVFVLGLFVWVLEINPFTSPHPFPSSDIEKLQD